VVLVGLVLWVGAPPSRGAAAPAARTAVPAATRPIRILNGWPCAGCIVQLPAGYSAAHPAALVVALHGDEGVPGPIAGVLSPATGGRNAILFAPQCPTALGCRFANGAGFTNSWWGWLQYSKTYDDGWLGREIGLVEARYAVDRNREYAVGWSGGADYLGWYALRDGARFAGVAFVAGGVPYVQTCPSAHLAVYFLVGTADPRYQSGQPSAVRSVFERCGDQTTLVALPGADHQGTISALESRGFATKILGWLFQHRRS
jgi:hypothetical protein